MRGTRGHSTPDYYHSLTNYISQNSLPGLIITDCIPLLVSANLYHVHSFTHCKVLYVVALHSRTFFLVSCLLVFGFLACSVDYSFASDPCLFCLFVCLFVLFVWTAYLCFDLLPVYWITCLDCPFIKAAFGSLPSCLRAVS